MPPKRTVLNQDAIVWLEGSPELVGCSIVTSLPDISEFSSMTLSEWKSWFIRTSQLVLSKCPREGVTIFYQSDIKVEGQWIDKSYLCQKSSEATGQILLWHRIVCRQPAGTLAFGRPTYSHLLCFSRGVKPELKTPTADVLPDAGEVTWTRGMGAKACRAACEYILAATPTRTVVDPFCGHGSVLAIANEMGLDAIGVELGVKRAQKARTLELL